MKSHFTYMYMYGASAFNVLHVKVQVIYVTLHTCKCIHVLYVGVTSPMTLGCLCV